MAKADLIAEAREKGIDIPDSKTIPEIKAILAEAAPKEADLDAADQTIPANEEDAPDSIQELAALDDPTAPLPHTPAESLTEYDAVGNLGAKHSDPDVKAADDGGVPPEVARGPLAGTPPDGWREDYNGPRFVAGPSQPVNTDPHQRGGADSKPDESDASREKVQEKANAPTQVKDGV